jgi:hypothetical protein
VFWKVETKQEQQRKRKKAKHGYTKSRQNMMIDERDVGIPPPKLRLLAYVEINPNETKKWHLQNMMKNLRPDMSSRTPRYDARCSSQKAPPPLGSRSPVACGNQAT